MANKIETNSKNFKPRINLNHKNRTKNVSFVSFSWGKSIIIVKCLVHKVREIITSFFSFADFWQGTSTA